MREIHDNKVKVGFVYSPTSKDKHEVAYNEGFNKNLDRLGFERVNLDFHQIIEEFFSFGEEKFYEDDDFPSDIKEEFKNKVRKRLEDLDLNGIILPGNYYNMVDNNINPSPNRRILQDALIELAQEMNMPMLAVCGGEQHIAHKYGATITPAVREVTKHNHAASETLYETSQFLRVTPDTMMASFVAPDEAGVGKDLYKIRGKGTRKSRDSYDLNTVEVGCYHNQAALNNPESRKALEDQGFVISATDSTGKIIEAFERENFIATQFHPEFLADSSFQINILKAFLKMTQAYEESNNKMPSSQVEESECISLCEESFIFIGR